MKKYNKKEYLKYVERLKFDVPKANPIDYRTWKFVQPIADEASGLSNGIIRNHISKKEVIK